MTEHQPYYSVEWVGPERAAELLALNFEGNRRQRNNNISKWARAMSNGEWTLGNDAICLGEHDTVLYNGQNRLRAVIRSGATVPMVVGHNISREAFRNMDRGAGRTFSDQLTGRKNQSLLAASVRIIATILDPQLTTTTVGDGDMWRALELHPNIEHSVGVAAGIKQHFDCSPSALAVAHWAIAQTNGAEVADHFVHQLAYRLDEPAGSAVHAITTRLRIAKRSGRRTFNDEAAALIVNGWNQYAVGKKVRGIDFPQSWRPFPSAVKAVES